MQKSDTVQYFHCYFAEDIMVELNEIGLHKPMVSLNAEGKAGSMQSSQSRVYKHDKIIIQSIFASSHLPSADLNAIG